MDFLFFIQMVFFALFFYITIQNYLKNVHNDIVTINGQNEKIKELEQFKNDCKNAFVIINDELKQIVKKLDEAGAGTGAEANIDVTNTSSGNLISQMMTSFLSDYNNQ